MQRHPGLGLGLWICKQIVDASHGTNHRRRANRAAAPRSASSCRGRHERRPRLLVVDDDLELCESLVDALTDAGYEPVVGR